jgi:hypothetical protein
MSETTVKPALTLNVLSHGTLESRDLEFPTTTRGKF